MRHLVFGAAVLLSATALTAAPGSARERGDSYAVTPAQVVDMADARIAQLKADLRLTADQDKNWGSFQTALHDMAQRRADRMNKMRTANADQRTTTTDGRTASTDGTGAPASDPNTRPRDDRDARSRDDRDNRAPDLVAEMRMQADNLTARADDYRKFADAAGPLYGSLDDGQRRRFLGFVQRTMMDDPDGGGRRGRY